MRTLTRRLPIKVDLERMQSEQLVHAVCQARAITWLRRAADWEAAVPRPFDYPGRATPQQLEAAKVRCLGNAQRCRVHAQLLLDADRSPEESWIDRAIAQLHFEDWDASL